MKLSSSAFDHNSTIPVRCAFGKFDPKTHFTLSDNVNPDLTWSEVPAGTKSLVLICEDDKVPSVGDDVNQEGKTIPASLPRVEFCHWAVVDLDPAAGGINEGEFSKGVTPKGKNTSAMTVRRPRGTTRSSTTTTSSSTRSMWSAALWRATSPGTTSRRPSRVISSARPS